MLTLNTKTNLGSVWLEDGSLCTDIDNLFILDEANQKKVLGSLAGIKETLKNGVGLQIEALRAKRESSQDFYLTPPITLTTSSIAVNWSRASNSRLTTISPPRSA